MQLAMAHPSFDCCVIINHDLKLSEHEDTLVSHRIYP